MSRRVTEAEKAALDSALYGRGFIDQNGKHVPIRNVLLERKPAKPTAQETVGYVNLRKWLEGGV